MLVEFCQFYLIILMAMVLIGVIMYGAVQAETSSPPFSSSNSVSTTSTSTSKARLTRQLGSILDAGSPGSFVGQSQPGWAS
jgi:hypothetical protein